MEWPPPRDEPDRDTPDVIADRYARFEFSRLTVPLVPGGSTDTKIVFVPIAHLVRTNCAGRVRDDLDEAGIAAREKQARDDAHWKVWRQREGMVRLSAILSPEVGELVHSSFDVVTSPRRGRRLEAGRLGQANRLRSAHDGSDRRRGRPRRGFWWTPPGRAGGMHREGTRYAGRTRVPRLGTGHRCRGDH